MNKLKGNRYLISRRVVQVAILTLFVGGNYFDWNVLTGNYSAATLLNAVHLADPFAALQILVSGFIVGTDVLVGAATILAVYFVLGGRVFCSWVCPMNLLSDSALWLRKKFKIKDTHGLKLSRKARYYLLGMSLVLSVFLGYAAFEMVSPISLFHRAIVFGAGGTWAIILAMFLFELTLFKNGWCGHLCPLGGFYGLLGNYGLLKIFHIQENCTKCNKCFIVCPERQVLDIVTKQSGFIKSGECTNCARCVDVCGDHSLKFAVRYFKR